MLQFLAGLNRHINWLESKHFGIKFRPAQGKSPGDQNPCQNATFETTRHQGEELPFGRGNRVERNNERIWTRIDRQE